MRQKTFIFTLILGGLFVAQSVGATVALVDTPPIATDILRLGSRGDAVRVLQLQLSKIPGAYPEALITGYFGPLTEKAVKKLQSQNGLEVVGVVGPKTRQLLNNLSKSGLFTMSTDAYAVPQVYVIESSSNAPTKGYVFWTTNRMTTSEFWYGNTTPVTPENGIKITDSVLNFTHSVNLSGLSTSTTYYYIIKVSDEKGNSATSTEKSLTTLAQ